MLTWSDWHTEPRSNRYHYATRFARRWHVYFVQPDAMAGEIRFEKLDEFNITLVHVGPETGPAAAARLAAALRARGMRDPLVWVYNVFMAGLIRRLHPALVVYHATENYLESDDALQITSRNIATSVEALLQRVDYVVAVSEGVAVSHRRVVPRSMPVMVLANGCDFNFWNETGASTYRPPDDGAKVALFQGGINQRLDFELLENLSRLLPNWEFWFCGKSIDGGAAWNALKSQPNVRDFGLVTPEGIADLARRSLVGLIPFKQSPLMQLSLPLKAYEYVACGLPVVTIPIDALSPHPDLFTQARTAEEFAAAIVQLAPSRLDAPKIASRLRAAQAESYDARFDRLICLLDQFLEQRARRRPSLNILILYDDSSTHVGTIAEHLEAFRKHSVHHVHYMPATGNSDGNEVLDLSAYDAIVVHYSVRLSLSAHLGWAAADAVAAYSGPKVLFIQDEYDHVEMARSWMERLGITSVFTTIPAESVDDVYPRARFPDVDFVPTLTGYVPEDPQLEDFVLPLADRPLWIGYRGRILPHQYGELGHEKYRIGVEVRSRALARGIPVDIEVDDRKRIYGLDWYRFVASARATLGTESGSSVFDMDGRLAALADRHAAMPFAEFQSAHLSEHEGRVRMNQISPKVFEAIRLRTALILFEGSYSGVVQPGRHYIPLMKDFSNIEEVFKRLADLEYLRELTDRAYDEVVAPGTYSYRAFVRSFDEYISSRAGGRRRATIISMPVAAAYDADDADPLLTRGLAGPISSDVVFSRALPRDAGLEFSRTAIAAAVVRPTCQEPENASIGPSRAIASARYCWRLLPMPIRRVALTGARPFWRLLPLAVRSRIAGNL